MFPKNWVTNFISKLTVEGMSFSLCLLIHLNVYWFMFFCVLIQYYYIMTVALKTLFLDVEFLQGRSHVLLIPVFP